MPRDTQPLPPLVFWGMDLRCLPGFLQLTGRQGIEMGLAVFVGALCLNNSAFMEALETTWPGSVLSTQKVQSASATLHIQ